MIKNQPFRQNCFFHPYGRRFHCLIAGKRYSFAPMVWYTAPPFRRNSLHHIVRNILCSFHSCERRFCCLIAKDRNRKLIRTAPQNSKYSFRFHSLKQIYRFFPGEIVQKSVCFSPFERLFNNQKRLISFRQFCAYSFITFIIVQLKTRICIYTYT